MRDFEPKAETALGVCDCPAIRPREIFPCLMDTPRGSVMPTLRLSYDAELFDELLARAMGEKAAEHPHDACGVMTKIGG